MSDKSILFSDVSQTLKEQTITELLEENKKNTINKELNGIKVKINTQPNNNGEELDGIIVKLYEHKAIVLCKESNKISIKSVFYGNITVCDQIVSQWF